MWLAVSLDVDKISNIRAEQFFKNEMQSKPTNGHYWGKSIGGKPYGFNAAFAM